MKQVNVRVCPELLKKLKEKAGTGWGARRKALGDGIKLYLWRKGEFTALAGQELVTRDDLRTMLKGGEPFTVRPLCGCWNKTEREVLGELAAQYLDEHPPDNIAFTDLGTEKTEEGSVDKVREAFAAGKHVWATLGGKEGPKHPQRPPLA
jgi:hypothetical protein